MWSGFVFVLVCNGWACLALVRLGWVGLVQLVRVG